MVADGRVQLLSDVLVAELAAVDVHVLGCPLSAAADAVVTGDRDLLD
jgi:hypothetical protein